MIKTLDLNELKPLLLNGVKIIDVRAPIEYSQGALPNSVNLPILDDDERAQVGSCFKKSGQEKAIELGHRIVSGENKDVKIANWMAFINENPHAILTCFRGGLRSQLAQQFLADKNIDIKRIQRGYKEIRQYFIDEINSYASRQFPRVLTGNTGSGKTTILKQSGQFYPVVDLEDLAKHRGSAFGSMKESQPAQASFENLLGSEILKRSQTNPNRRILFEDESRLIGRIHLPELFFERLRASPVIKMNVTLERRIENIFTDYIYPEEAIFEKYVGAVTRITKKLGGLRSQELLSDLAFSRKQFVEEGLLVSNRVWIEKLLVWYYDPMYTFSLTQRNPKIEFQGSETEVIAFLKD